MSKEEAAGRSPSPRLPCARDVKRRHVSRIMARVETTSTGPRIQMYDVALGSKSVASEICRATALSSIELYDWAAVGEYSDAILHAAAPTASHALTMGGAAAQRKYTERANCNRADRAKYVSHSLTHMRSTGCLRA